MKMNYRFSVRADEKPYVFILLVYMYPFIDAIVNIDS